MARRYNRREFLTDASFTLAASILLKVLAPTGSKTGYESTMEQAAEAEKTAG